MEQTLLKVKNLEKYIKKHGDDTIISQTISKMVAYKVQRYESQISRLNKNLGKFEKTYKKDSSKFFEEYNEGNLGDEIDFVEWSSLYQMRNSIIEKKKELESMI